MGTVRLEDLGFVQVMKNEGIFLPVDPDKRDLSRGITTVMCPDCHQRRDWTQHMENMLEKAGVSKDLLHPLGLNGGALGIPLGSPINPDDHKGQSYLGDIYGTSLPEVKGIDLVGLFGHFPCGAAGLAGLSFRECLDLLMKAETRVKDRFPTFRVHAFFHIDRGENFADIQIGFKKRRVTYFVSHRAYLAWRAEKDARADMGASPSEEFSSPPPGK